MESAPCFRALGLCELAENRETVETAYEAKRKEIRGDTESGMLARRLLEENYRACLRLIDVNQ